MSIPPLLSRAPREQIQLTHAGQLRLRLQCQAPTSEAAPRADVLYVHYRGLAWTEHALMPRKHTLWNQAFSRRSTKAIPTSIAATKPSAGNVPLPSATRAGPGQ